MEYGGIIKHDINKSPKTGDWRVLKPEVDASKCIGCQTCVPHCPDAVMEMRARRQEEIEISNKIGNPPAGGKEIVDIDMEFCKGCGVCAQVCPVKAIIMKK